MVAGNCGFSIAPTRPDDRELVARTLQKVEDMDPASLMAGIPWDFETFPEYLASVERRRHGAQLRGLRGPHALRLYVMGDEASDRAATPEEIARMAGLVGEAMDAGAAGLATSFAITHLGADGRPIPSRLAQKDELAAIFGAVGESGRGVVGINGGEGLTLATSTTCSRPWAPPSPTPRCSPWPTAPTSRPSTSTAPGSRKGADVWPQVSCRPLSFSMPMTEPFTLTPTRSSRR